ncbi:hypothetical protein Tco_0514517 [Tanacetum coccineum]
MEFLSEAAAPGGRGFFLFRRGLSRTAEVCAGRQRTRRWFVPGGRGLRRAAPRITLERNGGYEDWGLGLDNSKVLVAPEVGVAAVASPAGVLELDTHSSSKVNPLESSPPPVSVAPMVSPFLCSDDSESDTEIPKRHVSPITSTPETPTAPILPAPSAVVAPSSEFPLAPGIDHEEVDHSSSGHSISGHSLPGHSPPDTTIADSSTPPRFVHLPLARTLRCSEAYLR